MPEVDPAFVSCRIDGIFDGTCSFRWRKSVHFANENRMQINTMARYVERMLQAGVLVPPTSTYSKDTAE
jgi:hypothetical protein